MNKHTRSVSLIDGHTEDRTDAEIIKALEQCQNVVMHDCKKCSYHKKYNGKCVVMLTRDALDLINRQQAEIKQFETIERLATKTIEKQDAEIEKLNVELVGMRGACESYKIHYDNAQAEIQLLHKTKQLIKSEAIKEFWKRFDKVLCENIGPSKRVYWKISSDGNNLVKEMTEGEEN